jgi:hypothetical protein
VVGWWGRKSEFGAGWGTGLNSQGLSWVFLVVEVMDGLYLGPIGGGSK